MKALSTVKNAFVNERQEPRKIVAGPFRGIVMNLSLRTQSQVYLGLFERETYNWIRLFSKGIQTAIDVGAAYGEYTFYFALKTSAKRIYAFEPDKNCLPALEDGLGLNGRGEDAARVVVCTAFVGDAEVGNTVTLDSLANLIEPPCFIKVDVDGGEEAVLRGAKRLIALQGIRWLIETHSRVLEDTCIQILRQAGFNTKVVKNAWWRVFIPEQRPSAHNRWLVAWKPNRA